MKFIRNIIVCAVILGLFTLVSPVIKASAGELVSSVGSDTTHAVATVTENGGFSDTWNSFTKLIGDIVDEATRNTDK